MSRPVFHSGRPAFLGGVIPRGVTAGMRYAESAMQSVNR